MAFLPLYLTKIACLTVAAFLPLPLQGGMGAWRYGKFVKVCFNHEIGNTSGPTYTVNGNVEMTGTRMTCLKVDADTRKVVGGDQAYTEVSRLQSAHSIAISVHCCDSSSWS